jgi:hypothetical protein
MEARELAIVWHKVDHPHKSLVDIEALRAGGTGYYIKYPLRVIQATIYQLVNKNKTKE